MLTAIIFRLLALTAFLWVRHTTPLGLMTAELAFFIAYRMSTAIHSGSVHVLGVIHADSVAAQAPPGAAIFRIAQLALSAF